MRLIITGGGTGGHLFPGIALATGLKQRDPATRVLFIGTSRLMDQQALAGRGFELAALECGGRVSTPPAESGWHRLCRPC